MRMKRAAWGSVVLIATALLAASALALISKAKAQDRPADFSQPGGAVGVGVSSNQEFEGARPAIGPDFIFQVHNDLSWTVVFLLQVDVADVASVGRMPDVTIILPKESHNCRPLGVSSNDNESLKPNYTRLDAPGLENVVYQLKPFPVADSGTGNLAGAYSLRCDAAHVTTTPAGIAAQNFEIHYLPALANQLGLVPGLGALTQQLSVSYMAYRDQKNKADQDVVLHPELLTAQPSQKADNVCYWLINLSKEFSVDGMARKWWIDWISTGVDKFPLWIFGIVAAMSATAIIKGVTSWISQRMDGSSA